MKPIRSLILIATLILPQNISTQTTILYEDSLVTEISEENSEKEDIPPSIFINNFRRHFYESIMVSCSETQDISESENQSENPYSEEEIYLMAQAVFAESNIEPYEGQVAVATVILNRVESDDYPDTVYGVLSQKGAFSSWNVVKKGNIIPTDQNIQAVLEAIENRDRYPLNMYWFRADKYHTFATPYVKIGNHYFSTGD